MEKIYTDSWFSRQPGDTRHSARVICELLMKWIQPRSAVDVGCGLGTWLHELKNLGVPTILGVDGPWVNVNQLQIREDEFAARNLEQDLSLGRNFDLVLCLELAEHLSHDRANSLVKSLVNLGPVVLFSAAVPFQGGRHHINEQWPKYWVERFNTHGFAAIDCIRKRVWENPDVLVHYKQNTILFAESSILEKNAMLRDEYQASLESPISVVHPDLYMLKLKAYSNLNMFPVGRIVRALPGRVLGAGLRRLRSYTSILPWRG